MDTYRTHPRRDQSMTPRQSLQNIRVSSAGMYVLSFEDILDLTADYVVFFFFFFLYFVLYCHILRCFLN